MGKSRRSRGNKPGSARADPLAKPVKPPSDPELAALREKSILPVLKDLQSPEPKSRTTAAAAIANIIQDTKCRKLLLREQVVQIVLKETLTDASLESRAAGWEILRVLVAEEEADFCVHLYRVDVLTAIHHAAKKLNESLTSQTTPFTKLSKAEQSFTWIVAEALVAILEGLAEAQDEALAGIAQDQAIVSMLFNLVAADFTTTEVLNSTLSCLLVLSEDNKQFVEILLADAGATKCYENLAALQRGDGMKAVLACGVLHNIFSVMGWHDQNPGRDGGCDAALVPTLSQSLERTELSGKAADEGEPGSSSPVDVLRLALEILASMGTALQQALESNAKAADEAWEGIKDDNKEDDVMKDDGINDDKSDKDAEEAEAEDDDEEDDEDNEMNQDELEADMDLVTGADDYPDEASGIDDLPTLRELIHNAVPRIIKICQRTAAAKGGAEDEAAALVRSYAFNALNNISWTISCIDFSDGQNAAIQAAWLPTARTIWKDAIAPVLASDTSDVDLATSVTSLAWAVARTLHAEKTEGLLLHGEQNKFISLYHASQNLATPASSDESAENGEDPFQSLGVKCVGVLGQLAQDPAPVELNREIGVFLITVVASLPETQPAAAVEALNQLFDIYGDEDKACDKEVFWKDNFLPHFEAMLPKLRTMVKKIDKRASAELRTRADESVLNLQRFISYKKKHHP
ncbi:hypothetical protein Micbo1qcDRAFT_233478 [Microdochium bolleyi]|uniref:SYO1-like TPR repeats domain-containing protein n=1 Tax=Microdochium bolleyi TaxID=196109 RepID=A0A136J4Y3_9PEZI|nr:hypothetical protein Micbo1qcDRAFT_233478 [Microdochium bolleyi]